MLVHEVDVVGTLNMDAVQIEVPQCIRNAAEWYNPLPAHANLVRKDFADKLAQGTCDWLDNVFPEQNGGLC